MNIFDIYLDNIKKIVIDQQKKGILKIPDNLDAINVDIPPKQFNCDISTNVAMVLSKINQKSPTDLANIFIELIKKNDANINSITVVKPGFINIKFKSTYWNNFVKEILKDQKKFGINTKEKKTTKAKKLLRNYLKKHPKNKTVKNYLKQLK